MEILIAGIKKEQLKKLNKQLTPVSVGILCMNSIDILKKSLHHHTRLLIVDEHFLSLTLKQLGTDFLQHTPCLVLVENLSNLSDNLADQPAIDFLSIETPTPFLRHKVRYLLHQKSILDEKQALNRKLADAQQSIIDNMGMLDSIAERDGLTGLYNRRYFNKTVLEQFLVAKENQQDLSLLLIDIDYFSQTNKTHGQQFGDFVLNELAARITKIFRPEDLTFRFGGEDFCVLLLNTSIEECLELSETFRNSCASIAFNNGQFERIITVSIGCTSIEGSQPRNHDEMVTMAEMALFSAKSEGRNRVLDYQSTIDYKHLDCKRNFLSLKNNLAKLLNKTKTSTISSLQLLARDVACDEDKQHTQYVNHYIELLCSNLNLPDNITATFGNAISLHSSIRCLLHNEIISKKDSLDETEKNIMQEFPYRLSELTELFDYFAQERSVLLSYGERYDGTGYPDGLKGHQIPLGSRVFNIVDSFAAMNSDRPYRKKLPPETIIEELINGAGKQFDPLLVKKLLIIILENNLLEIDQKEILAAQEKLNDKFPEMYS